jgi:thiamine biosynthesis lipoprotein
MSGGLFDITSGVLRRAWDFSKALLPSQSEVSHLLSLIGWDKVIFADHTISLPLKGMEIDFGGFGKEYATDRAAGILAENGIKHGYVNLGGDIKAFGGQPDGSSWLFGVRDPRDAGSAVAQIAIRDGGLATSGDYEKFMEINGVRYCHILNPFTGFPVNCWRSVSVSGVSALMAGALSTIAMLKEAAAVQFLEESHCGYLLIDAGGRQETNRVS